MFEWLQNRRDRFGQREVVPVLLAATLLVTFVLYDRVFDVVDGPITCAFRILTGWQCPGCGLTRSVVSIGNARFLHSFSQHPLGIPLVLLLLAIVVSWVVGLAANKSPRRIVTRRTFTLLAVGFAAVTLGRIF